MLPTYENACGSLTVGSSTCLRTMIVPLVGGGVT